MNVPESPRAADERRRWDDLLRPCWHARSLFDVTPERLKNLGVEGVMLDMDNTLTEWRSESFTPEALAWMNALRDAGFKTCVVSNTNRTERLKNLCAILKTDYVLGVTKPRRRGFRLALEKMGTAVQTTAIVGDQIFTDVLGGNRMGLYTILVPPLSREEFVGTRWISRRLERALFSYLQRVKRLPPREP
jgi:HAD superfamily phosphatase (TIGR01668 family)